MYIHTHIPTIFLRSDAVATIFFRCLFLCGYYSRAAFISLRASDCAATIVKLQLYYVREIYAILKNLVSQQFHAIFIYVYLT